MRSRAKHAYICNMASLLDGIMSTPGPHLSYPPDNYPSGTAANETVSSASIVPHERPLTPQIRISPSTVDLAGFTFPTPPQDDCHSTRPRLELGLQVPGSSTPVASYVALSGTPTPPDMGNLGNSGTILGGPLVAEPSGDGEHRAIWLAASPVSFFTSKRYSQRDKL